MSEKFCPKCGKPVPEGARFCGSCCAPLTSTANEAPVLGGDLTPDPHITIPWNNVNNDHIDNNGYDQQTEISVEESAPAKKRGLFWIIGFFVLLVASLVLGFLLYKSYEDSDSLSTSMNRENNRFKNQVDQLTYELSEAQAETQQYREEAYELTAFKNLVSSQIPFLITDMKIENIDYSGDLETPSGSTIYSRDTKYIRPKITYYGINPGYQTIYFKFFQPSGAMSTETGSPSGYTYSESITVESGSGNEVAFNGWGSNVAGHWDSGQYRFEVWCGDMCLKAKTFYIY